MTKHFKYVINALIVFAAIVGCAMTHTALGADQGKKPPAKKPDDGGQSRGTKQVAGGDGIFGVVYTLNSGFNFTILSVRYTLEPHNDYNGTMAKSDEKLVRITVAIKNSDKSKDKSWGGFDVMLVDDKEIGRAHV